MDTLRHFTSRKKKIQHWNVKPGLFLLWLFLLHAGESCYKAFHQIRFWSLATPENSLSCLFHAGRCTTFKGVLQRTLHRVFLGNLWALQIEQLNANTPYSACSQDWMDQSEADVTPPLYSQALMHFCQSLRKPISPERVSQRADDFWVLPVMRISSSKGWQEWKFNHTDYIRLLHQRSLLMRALARPTDVQQHSSQSNSACKEGTRNRPADGFDVSQVGDDSGLYGRNWLVAVHVPSLLIGLHGTPANTLPTQATCRSPGQHGTIEGLLLQPIQLQLSIP